MAEINLDNEMSAKYNNNLDEISVDETSYTRGSEEYTSPDEDQITTHNSKPTTLRQKIFLSFDDPYYSKFSFAYSAFMIFLVVLSTALFLASSLPQYWSSNDPYLYNLEIVVISFFTFDYIVRIVNCSNVKRFVKDPFNVIDLLAIIPFYITLIITLIEPNGLDASSIAVLRVIRLLRVFRAFKIGKYTNNVTILVKTFKQSKEGFTLLAFILFLGLIVFSSLMFYAEQSEAYFDQDSLTWIYNNGNPSPYQSIPAAFWWCIITMTTVGYGDVYPITIAGKFIGSLTAITGVLVLALPITVLGANFNEVWCERKALLEIKNRLSKSKKLSKATANFKKEQFPKKLHEIEYELTRVGKYVSDLESLVKTITEQHKNLSTMVGLVSKSLEIS